jgi:hypothetical protein
MRKFISLIYFISALKSEAFSCKMLITSIVGVIIAYTLLGITGLIIEPVSVNAVLFSLAYSTVFTLSIDPIKLLMFKKIGLIS